MSNLWGLTASKTVVSGDTFRLLEWVCALFVGFIVFEVVNNLVKEKLSTQRERISTFIRDRGWISALEASAPDGSKQLIARFTKSLVASGTKDADSVADVPKKNP